MTDIATYFPPQTYSSSFFLNTLGEEDGGGGRRKIRVRDKEAQDSPTFLDCFITKMCKPFPVALPLFIILLQYFSSFSLIKGECVDESVPRTRVFVSIAEFQDNSVVFDPTRDTSKGNYVTFSESINTTLFKNSFIAYDSEHIRKLSLDNHQIQAIEEGAFLSLNCVAILNLRKNNIDSISTYMFQGLYHLHELDLGENRIKDVPEYVFRLNVLLKRLNLTRNNIRTVHPESFHELVWLEQLDLSYNRLFRVPPQTFQYFRNLFMLQMGSNNIEVLDVDKWRNLTKLKVFNLSDNALVSFDFSNEFSFSHSLEQLYLDENCLTRLNPLGLRRNLPKLKIIDISENFWICGDLAPILKVLNDSHIEYRGPEVLSDPNMNGIACNRSEEYKKHRRNDTEIETTTIGAKASPSSITPSTDTEELSLRSVYRTNMSILDAISSLQTIIVCLFVVILIFILIDVMVRMGCLSGVFNRRGRGIVLDNSDVESFSLVRDSS